MMEWIQDHLWLCISLAAFAVGLLWMSPGRGRRRRLLGLIPIIAALLIQADALHVRSLPMEEHMLLVLFGGGALVAGVLMISSRNPIYAALWFAIVTLCTCGLFVLQSAPFLAAATVIVYAGAIIVTFIFVIMLAQQEGAAVYDRVARRPVSAVLLGTAFLGLMLFALQLPAEAPRPVAENLNPLSRPAGDLGTMHSLGRSLFGDYLFAVEVAGTLLLVASIGAIVIAPRKGRKIS